MGMPKWECPSASHVKKDVGPKWDQHGNAQVGKPILAPSGPAGQNIVGPNWAAHMGPMWATPLSNGDMGPTWE